jgi:hypothetical protein
MLTPLSESLPPDLQARGYHILETLHGLPLEQQLNLACRTLLAFLLRYRPSPSAPKADRDALKTICDEVQVWLKEEIAEMRRVPPARTATTRKRQSQKKTGHA